MKKRIAIFASGSGSNAQKIMEYFKNNNDFEVALVLSNQIEAYVLQRADRFEIPTYVFNRNEFYNTDTVESFLERSKIDLIVLAGFLWLIPEKLIKKFPNKIINIHPSLLPKFGGKGMYGDNVHQAVMQAKEPHGGITIHYVNQNYDEGEYIYQAKYAISETDNLDMIKFKGQQIEHLHYPRIIEEVIKQIK
ncbi:MAG: phosphoribosylglycinamide formyltransferase [Sphingobacteriaceae bacterium]|nr:phosphoribosylglycinamide formyltransferase [Sphingobacteriaceae bacterium]